MTNDFEEIDELSTKLARDINEIKTELDHKHIIIMDKTVGSGDHFEGLREAQISRNGNKKFAKIWLLNAQDINGNGWGVAQSTLDHNIKNFIGKPFVVTAQDFLEKPSPYGDQYVHPSLPTSSINANLTHQENFRVGNIVDIMKNGPEYYAQIEILPKYHDKTLPPFCSPALFQVDLTEDPHNISKWEALHLAGLTERPAFGARVAILKGTCVGSQNECKVQFRQAQVTIKCAKTQMEEKRKFIETKLSLLK